MYWRTSCPNLELTVISQTGYFVRPSFRPATGDHFDPKFVWLGIEHCPGSCTSSILFIYQAPKTREMMAISVYSQHLFICTQPIITAPTFFRRILNERLLWTPATNFFKKSYSKFTHNVHAKNQNRTTSILRTNGSHTFYPTRFKFKAPLALPLCSSFTRSRPQPTIFAMSRALTIAIAILKIPHFYVSAQTPTCLPEYEFYYWVRRQFERSCIQFFWFYYYRHSIFYSNHHAIW